MLRENAIKLINATRQTEIARSKLEDLVGCVENSPLFALEDIVAGILAEEIGFNDEEMIDSWYSCFWEFASNGYVNLEDGETEEPIVIRTAEALYDLFCPDYGCGDDCECCDHCCEED